MAVPRQRKHRPPTTDCRDLKSVSAARRLAASLAPLTASRLEPAPMQLISASSAIDPYTTSQNQINFRITIVAFCFASHTTHERGFTAALFGGCPPSTDVRTAGCPP